MRGNIFDIKRYAIHDGPGIRTTVFLKGCRLHCRWCHNPESQTVETVSMKQVRKLGDREFEEIRKVGYGISVDELVEEIAKDAVFFEESGGGVTFSGGEPLEQAENLSKLAEKIKTLGLDILVYSGYTMEYILSKLDEKPHWKELLMNCDTLIDGPFILKKRSLELRFRGSSNQRVIDLKRSLTEKLVVEKSEI